MNITPYYHVSAMGNWQSVVTEQLTVLHDGGFEGIVKSVVCGSEMDLHKFLEIANATQVRVEVIGRCMDSSDYEFPTLAAMQQDCLDERCDHVLYFHTKGVSQSACELRKYWRWFMNAYMLRDCPKLAAVLGEHDFCGPVIAHLPMRHSCGNYFAASAAYLRKLPLIEVFRKTYHEWIKAGATYYFEERHAAEMWIDCLGIAKALQLHPDPDCDIAQEEWWKKHPEIREFARLQGGLSKNGATGMRGEIDRWRS